MIVFVIIMIMLVIHLQERPYICGLCGDTFAQSEDLRTHHASHSNTSIIRKPHTATSASTTIITTTGTGSGSSMLRDHVPAVLSNSGKTGMMVTPAMADNLLSAATTVSESRLVASSPLPSLTSGSEGVRLKRSHSPHPDSRLASSPQAKRATLTRSPHAELSREGSQEECGWVGRTGLGEEAVSQQSQHLNVPDAASWAGSRRLSRHSSEDVPPGGASIPDLSKRQGRESRGSERSGERRPTICRQEEIEIGDQDLVGEEFGEDDDAVFAERGQVKGYGGSEMGDRSLSVPALAARELGGSLKLSPTSPLPSQATPAGHWDTRQPGVTSKRNNDSTVLSPAHPARSVSVSPSCVRSMQGREGVGEGEGLAGRPQSVVLLVQDGNSVESAGPVCRVSTAQVRAGVALGDPDPGVTSLLVPASYSVIPVQSSEFVASSPTSLSQAGVYLHPGARSHPTSPVQPLSYSPSAGYSQSPSHQQPTVLPQIIAHPLPSSHPPPTSHPHAQSMPHLHPQSASHPHAQPTSHPQPTVLPQTVTHLQPTSHPQSLPQLHLPPYPQPAYQQHSSYTGPSPTPLHSCPPTSFPPPTHTSLAESAPPPPAPSMMEAVLAAPSPHSAKGHMDSTAHDELMDSEVQSYFANQAEGGPPHMPTTLLISDADSAAILMNNGDSDDPRLLVCEEEMADSWKDSGSDLGDGGGEGEGDNLGGKNAEWEGWGSLGVHVQSGEEDAASSQPSFMNQQPL